LPASAARAHLGQVYVNPNVSTSSAERHLHDLQRRLHYDFRTHARTSVGAGLAVAYRDPDGPVSSDTDVGANFLAGIGARGRVIPYLQAKLIVKDNTQFSIAAGLRF
jgi:hypothetical protein